MCSNHSDLSDDGDRDISPLPPQDEDFVSHILGSVAQPHEVAAVGVRTGRCRWTTSHYDVILVHTLQSLASRALEVRM